MHLSLDFETRSELDLTKVGAYRYAAHESTRVLCAGYAFDDGPIQCWRPWVKEPVPKDLDDALEDPDVLIAAWNAPFERQILIHRLDFQDDIGRFRCTQARARALALPAKLELCAKFLNAPIQKTSNRIMLKWCKSLPKGGWADDPAEYEELVTYCMNDVATERQLANMLPPLTEEALRDWQINETINDNGIPIDLDLIRAAQRYAADEQKDINAALKDITDGAVTSCRQFQRIKDWLKSRGVEIPVNEKSKESLDASARDTLLENMDEGPARDFLELVADGGKSSISKFKAMEERAVNGRVQGAYILNGAGQTGRYSSQGAQLHNYIREALPNTEDVVDAILAGRSADDVTAVSGCNMLTTLSRLLRPSIVASPGKVLVWGDWSAIEARVAPWLSMRPGTNERPEVLDLFERGEDVYKHQARKSFSLDSVEDVTDLQRQGGKVQILSFAFAGGVKAGQKMAKKYGLSVSDQEIDRWKHAWRRSNPWAEVFWRELEFAALQAMRRPGEAFMAGRMIYARVGDFLYCVLPSNRVISYPYPKIESTAMGYGISFKRGAWHPKKEDNTWPRSDLYCGNAIENGVQGLAADLLRNALRVLDDDGWLDTVVGDTHDEIILEVDEADEVDARAELKAVMTTPPAWAPGLPLAVGISSGPVYGK